MFNRIAVLGAALVLTASLALDTSAQSNKFQLTGIGISPMKTANLCSKIGGKGTQPNLVVQHSAVAGVPITVRMYDVHSARDVTEHNTVRVTSSGSGKTTVNSGFRPPCNTTGGRKNSSYRFDISAGGQKTTVVWGNYDSAKKQITR